MNLPTPRIADADGYSELCCCRITQLPSFPSGIRGGQHVALLEPGKKGGAAPLVHSLIVSAKLTDGMRPVRLTLDSGTNVPFLYNMSDYMALGLYNGVALRGGGANGSQRAFTALPAQELKIGSVDIGKVTFITLAGATKDSRTSDFDG